MILKMIIFISDSLFLLYIVTFLVIIITIYKCIKAKKIETKTIVIVLIGVVYLLFYSYESIPSEKVQYNHIAISDVEGLSEKEIVNKILIQEFDYYKSERLFTKNQIFDYKINRINGPINDTSKTDNHYYDVSYSVKTIAPAWIAGNGKNEGLWVNSKSEFYNLIKNNDQYILNRVGGL